MLQTVMVKLMGHMKMIWATLACSSVTVFCCCILEGGVEPWSVEAQGFWLLDAGMLHCCCYAAPVACIYLIRTSYLCLVVSSVPVGVAVVMLDCNSFKLLPRELVCLWLKTFM